MSGGLFKTVNDGEQWVKDAFSTVHPLIYCITYLFLSGEER